MADEKEPVEAAPVGPTASIIREASKAAPRVLNVDPDKAGKWMVFVLMIAVIAAGTILGIRTITSNETIFAMHLRSTEQESEKCRDHATKEAEVSAKREVERTDKILSFHAEERGKDRLLGQQLRDELISLRVWLGKQKFTPPEDQGLQSSPLPRIKGDGRSEG